MKNLAPLWIHLPPTCILCGCVNDVIVYTYLTKNAVDSRFFPIIAKFLIFEQFILIFISFYIAHSAKKSIAGQLDPIEINFLYQPAIPKIFLLFFVFGNPILKSRFPIDEQISRSIGINYGDWTLLPISLLAIIGLYFSIWKTPLTSKTRPE